MSEHIAEAADVEEISDDIEHHLGHSWFFDPENITVTVEHGKVTLTGTVRSVRERRMAAAAAWSHEGVTDVENKLTVE
jgi:osmotically-inducible protein OsmY